MEKVPNLLANFQRAMLKVLQIVLQVCHSCEC